MLIQLPHPISDTYLDEQTVRASAALPAAGAWVTPTHVHCPCFTNAVLVFAYTRGGVGGAFEFKIEVARSTLPFSWIQAALYDPGTVAAGADTTSLIQCETLKHTSVDASLRRFPYQFKLEGLYEAIRVSVRETGAVGTPGTLAIYLSLS